MKFRAPINCSHLFHPERVQGGSVFIIQNPCFCAEGETGVNESHKGSELSAPGGFPGEEIFIEALRSFFFWGVHIMPNDS